MNQVLNQPRINSKKLSYSDYPNLSTYIRKEHDYFVEDLGSAVDFPKAHRAFKFLSDFEKADEFTKEALRGGYSSAEAVITDIKEKIEIYSMNEKKKHIRDTEEKAKTSEKAKEIFDADIKPLIESAIVEWRKLYDLPGYTPYVLEDQFDNAIDTLSRVARIRIDKMQRIRR